MKKYFLLLVSAFLCFSSCYDDAELRQSVDNLDKRVVKLEELCKQMNSNLSSLQTLVNAVNEKDFVTGVKNIENGYTISFSKSKPITLYNGKDGQDGKAGKTPAISVKKEADGNYYWTLDGEFILDGGKKIQANGTDGKDGIAPQLKIEKGKWLMKVGEADWKEIGQATGDAFFKSVKVSEKEVTVVLADGQTLVLPLLEKMAIQFTVPAKPTAGQTISVPFVVSGVVGKADVKAIGQNGWVVKVEQKTYTEGEIKITAPDPVTDEEIIVLVSNGEGQTIMSSISWVEEQLLISSVKEFKLKSTAGQFSFEISTNMEYNIGFTGNEDKWLKIVESKAMRTEDITIAYTENPALERKAELQFKDKGDQLILSLPIVQESSPASIQFIHPEANITSAAGEYALPIKVLNLPGWSVSSTAEWIQVAAKGNNEVALTVEENKTADRSAEIIAKGEIHGKKLETKIVVNQLAVNAVPDMLDFVLGDDQKAKDLSPAKREIFNTLGETLKLEKDPMNRNAAVFTTPFGDNPKAMYTFADFNMRPKFEDGYTLEAYVRVDEAPNGKESKALSSTRDGGTALMIAADKQLCFLYNGNPEGKKAWRFVKTGIIPTVGQWYHLIGTWDQKSGDAFVYLDGKQMKKENFGEVKLYYSNLGEKSYMTIGGNSGAGEASQPVCNGGWNGGISIARIYSEPLTPAQVKAAHINILPGKIEFVD